MISLIPIMNPSWIIQNKVYSVTNAQPRTYERIRNYALFNHSVREWGEWQAKLYTVPIKKWRQTGQSAINKNVYWPAIGILDRVLAYHWSFIVWRHFYRHYKEPNNKTMYTISIFICIILPLIVYKNCKKERAVDYFYMPLFTPSWLTLFCSF